MVAVLQIGGIVGCSPEPVAGIKDIIDPEQLTEIAVTISISSPACAETIFHTAFDPPVGI